MGYCILAAMFASIAYLITVTDDYRLLYIL